MRCSTEQAERLAQALRFRTVTLPPGTTRADPSYAPFASLLAFLRSSFPRAAEALRWEELGDLALLLTWEARAGAAETKALPVLLYAHFDVVPPGDESAWRHGAFSGDVAEGFVWGRGALDDKHCLLGILEAVESLLAEGRGPEVTVYMAFGGDEETVGTGARLIADTLAARGVRLSCVLDEGSVISDGIVPLVRVPLALVGVAEKGFANAEMTVRGSAGHSSTPGRGTAAGALAAVVAAVERRRFPLRLTGTTVGTLRALGPHLPGLRGGALRAIRLLWPFVRRSLGAVPVLDALLRTTQAVTILRAGDKENVLPAEARAVVNLRLLPGDSPESAVGRIHQVAHRALRGPFSLEVRLLPGATASPPVPETRPDPWLWDALCAAIRQAEPRAAIVPTLVVVYTDSRKFASLSASIVRFHPLVLTAEERGSIHSINERISLENYGRMIAFYRSILLAAP